MKGSCDRIAGKLEASSDPTSSLAGRGRQGPAGVAERAFPSALEELRGAGVQSICVRTPPALPTPDPTRVPRGLKQPLYALQGPRGPPQGWLASRCGAGATNGRVNWGKLTRSKTPQHLEKQEPGWGRGPERAIIHPGVLRPPAAPQLGPQPPVSKADKWRTVRL